MAQIDTKNFADIVARACAEARSIAERAASDPTVYLNPEIEAWGKKYCASRFFTADPLSTGYFDISEAAALAELMKGFPGSTLPAVDMNRFNAEATGSDKKSEAVINQIDRIMGIFTPQRMSDLYGQLTTAISKCLIVDAFYAYDGLFRSAEYEMTVLYNTMIKKMEKGSKPQIVAGTGQHIVNTPFGPIVVSDTAKKIGDYTEEEFILLMAQINQKK
jgi:hypothetical protein